LRQGIPVRARRNESIAQTASRTVAVLTAVMLVAGIVGSAAGSPRGSTAAVGAPAVASSGQERIAEPPAPENASEASQQSVHGEPLWVTAARLFNFAILVGVLVYFLRAPIAQYLARRSTEVRSDLVKAAETRAAAAAQLAAIEQRMQALPAELEALRRRGAEEIVAEEARIREVAAAERARLLEQARREIDLQLRAAERDLIRRAAELTVGLASDRIRKTITDEDRIRLVEQYLAHLPKQA